MSIFFNFILLLSMYVTPQHLSHAICKAPHFFQCKNRKESISLWNKEQETMNGRSIPKHTNKIVHRANLTLVIPGDVIQEDLPTMPMVNLATRRYQLTGNTS
jgi:hypothetical protein